MIRLIRNFIPFSKKTNLQYFKVFEKPQKTVFFFKLPNYLLNLPKMKAITRFRSPYKTIQDPSI